MKIATVPARHKPFLQALLTSTPGDVEVEANAALLVPPGAKKSTRRTYLWRASVDGGKTFVTGDPPRSRTPCSRACRSTPWSASRSR